MSGVDLDGRPPIRKGAADSVRRWVEEQGGAVPTEIGDDRRRDRRRRAGRRSSSPSATGRDPRARRRSTSRTSSSPGCGERFDELRAMGIRTVMITGDNPLTAAAIAKEAGVDDFLAEATPEDKMALIRSEQTAAGSSR